MTNKHISQQDIRQHISIEAFHKLNRASSTLHLFRIGKLNSGVAEEGLPFCLELMSDGILSYVHEDISFVLNELKEKGLCDRFIQQHY